MEVSRATVAIVAVSCVTAGAAGVYVLSRTPPAQGVTAVLAETPAAGVGIDAPEAVVDEAPIARASASRSTNRPRHVPPAPVERPAETAPVPLLEVPDDPQPAPEPVPEVVPIPPPPVAATRASEAEPPRFEPPAPELEDLVIAADSVIGLQIETAVSSETARVEDEVLARVTRDVRVGGRVVIPAGARARGEVTLVERGGKIRERARLGVRFTSIVLADGTRLPTDTEMIYREGQSPGRESTTKIGGSAIAGTIIGGILGGARGAAIGGAIGGGAGSAAVMAGGRNPATLAPGSPVTVRLLEPVVVTVER